MVLFNIKMDSQKTRPLDLEDCKKAQEGFSTRNETSMQVQTDFWERCALTFRTKALGGQWGWLQENLLSFSVAANLARTNGCCAVKKKTYSCIMRSAKKLRCFFQCAFHAEWDANGQGVYKISHQGAMCQAEQLLNWRAPGDPKHLSARVWTLAKGWSFHAENYFEFFHNEKR